MGLEDLMYLIWIALASASISFTITTTSIFKWLREWVGLIHPKIDELIHCPWCLGHYISLIVLLIFSQIDSWIVLIINWFSIMGLIGLIHYVLLRAYEPVAKATARRKLEKLNEEK